jgi:hypothetical protein
MSDEELARRLQESAQLLLKAPKVIEHEEQ